MLILIFLFFFNSYKTYKNEDIHVVISRYNENLDWLNGDLFNKYKRIVYLKGQTDDVDCTHKTCIHLNNVGREAHTYLHHIIENYNNLPDVTVFLPGSALDTIPHKKNVKTLNLFNTVSISKEKVKQQCDSGHNYFERIKDFTLDEYQSTNVNNRIMNPERKLQLSPIRPFGKWFKTNFNQRDTIPHLWFNGIFAVTKDQILQNPKELYMKLEEQLNSHSNPEVGHYMERSWAALFC